MSSIGSNHPFRNSVNHSSDSGNAQASPKAAAEPAAGEKAFNGESSDSFIVAYLSRLKPATRVKLLAGVGLVLAFLLVSVFDLVQGASDDADMYFSADSMPTSRSVGDARREAGFFASIFCRGAKRSSFCS